MNCHRIPDRLRIGITLPSQYIPSTVPANQQTAYNTLYNDVLGIVSQPQVHVHPRRQQPDSAAERILMFDQSIIPYYSAYFSDTWHMRPSFTLTYGMSYQLEMPPYEINGKQVMLVDAPAVRWTSTATFGRGNGRPSKARPGARL